MNFKDKMKKRHQRLKKAFGMSYEKGFDALEKVTKETLKDVERKFDAKSSKLSKSMERVDKAFSKNPGKGIDQLKKEFKPKPKKKPTKKWFI